MADSSAVTGGSGGGITAGDPGGRSSNIDGREYASDLDAMVGKSDSSRISSGSGSGSRNGGGAAAAGGGADQDGVELNGGGGVATIGGGDGGAGEGGAGEGETVRTGPVLPAREPLPRRSLTFAIRVCGSNGLARNPSQPTRAAFSWSNGSKAPVRSSTGMCDSAGFFLMKSQTS